jgi:hypothetical protein
VEQFVVDTLQGLDLIHEEERAHLISAGIEAAFRFDRALPPEHSLAPVLNGALTSWLTACGMRSRRGVISVFPDEAEEAEPVGTTL